jgi:hypothetical protein
MVRRTLLIFAFLAVVVGFGGYAFAGQPRYFAVAGFVAVILGGVLFALSGPSDPPVADDLRRADDHEYHPISQGPMERGPS